MSSFKLPTVAAEGGTGGAPVIQVFVPSKGSLRGAEKIPAANKSIVWMLLGRTLSASHSCGRAEEEEGGNGSAGSGHSLSLLGSDEARNTTTIGQLAPICREPSA